MSNFVSKTLFLKQILCSIITIGDELLIGQTIDTNSAWLAQHLNKIGIHVQRRIAVGDLKEDIRFALDQESNLSQLILITGGLGPTADDITKPLLCEYFGGTLIQNEQVLQHVLDIFTKRNRAILDVNLKQAMLPDNCKVLFNEVGTAAGMWFEKNKVIYISLPGVPFEMQHIMEKIGLPSLKEHFVTPHIHHRTLVTSGEGESFIAQRLIDFEQQLPSEIKLAYLPKLGVVKLRLSAVNVDVQLIDEQFLILEKLLKNIAVAAQDIELEEVIFNLLQSENKSLSIAESCTGGQLASRITSVKGSSEIFKGGMVPYSIESKINVLGVDAATIETFGVISQETVEEMAQKCRIKFKSDYALSVSGHLEKQSDETYVWIGLAKEGKTISKRISMYYDREKNAVLASNTALNNLRLFILAN